MNKKTITSSVAAIGIAVGGGTGLYNVGESEGRASAVAAMAPPVKGDYVNLKEDPRNPNVFATVSPDIPKDLLAKLMSICPTNKYVVFCGHSRPRK